MVIIIFYSQEQYPWGFWQSNRAETECAILQKIGWSILVLIGHYSHTKWSGEGRTFPSLLQRYFQHIHSFKVFTQLSSFFKQHQPFEYFRNASVYSLESEKRINKSDFSGDGSDADISSRFEVSNSDEMNTWHEERLSRGEMLPFLDFWQNQ